MGFRKGELITMSRCAECGIYACRVGKLDKAPEHCPMLNCKEVYEEARVALQEPDTLRLMHAAAWTEATGYRRWTRMEEILEFSRKRRFTKLGLAFCSGLVKEAAEVAKILKEAGFIVESIICKTGSVPKEEIGIREDEKIRPGQFEPTCNPVAQAKILNAAGTELNIALGLCVGHDSVFFKHSNAPVTVLAAKDRVLAHNPLGVIYASHYHGVRFSRFKQGTP
ncbi:DUF1847 domain-containing protein [Desulfoglaeba alkanexedens]